MLNHFWPIFMLVLQKRSIHALSERKQDIFHVKSLVMFTFEMEKFWYIKITQIQRVTNFFWRTGSPLSLIFLWKEKWFLDAMEEFVETFYSFEHSGNLHSADDTNDSNEVEDNDYQITALETEDVEEEMDEPEQTDLENDKNLDIPVVTNEK